MAVLLFCGSQGARSQEPKVKSQIASSQDKQRICSMAILLLFCGSYGSQESVSNNKTKQRVSSLAVIPEERPAEQSTSTMDAVSPSIHPRWNHAMILLQIIISQLSAAPWLSQATGADAVSPSQCLRSLKPTRTTGWQELSSVASRRLRSLKLDRMTEALHHAPLRPFGWHLVFFSLSILNNCY